MNTPKRSFLLAVVALAAVAASASAAVPDAGAKARGDFSGRGMERSSRTYYYSAPIRTMPAQPSIVAQQPTERRSFSAEPTPAMKAAPKMAEQPRVTRSYSVEPAPAMRTYAPSYRARSSQPLWSLPKSNDRKFGG